MAFEMKHAHGSRGAARSKTEEWERDKNEREKQRNLMKNTMHTGASLNWTE